MLKGEPLLIPDGPSYLYERTLDMVPGEAYEALADLGGDAAEEVLSRADIVVEPGNAMMLASADVPSGWAVVEANLRHTKFAKTEKIYGPDNFRVECVLVVQVVSDCLNIGKHFSRFLKQAE